MCGVMVTDRDMSLEFVAVLDLNETVYPLSLENCVSLCKSCILLCVEGRRVICWR